MYRLTMILNGEIRTREVGSLDQAQSAVEALAGKVSYFRVLQVSGKKKKPLSI